ncbi:MAG: hypothetical protein WBS24_16635 [Terriglobales bacterium]
MLRIFIRGFRSADKFIVAIATSLLAFAAFAQTTPIQSTSAQSSSGQSSSTQSSSGQSSSARSLGDIARENQARKAAQASSSAEPKVITNSDLPKNPDGYTTPTVKQMQKSPATAANAAADRQRAVELRAAAQWRQRILTQENKVANLQERVDRMRAEIRFMNQNSDYGSAVAYNRGQARQMERLQEAQSQLNQQKQRLDQMQEAARHAGMHSAVYDP